ncbi:putative tail fiber protein [Erwinia phage pEp_SNUABM_12]|uniref:Putative tail fiber protein n=1 Tax=Erwinia phage pEp_SNUABM_12 TaxID=2772019 RepID=A0A7L7SXX7_9CAUD|nr:putative tail fiber protein [Erwinia phage pEp_SNUABM_12]
MANTIKTVMTYPLNGSTVDFNIPFEYLARKFVTITLIGTDRKVLVLNQDYRFSTKTTITLTKAWGPADGYDTIEVRRYTSATDRLVDFADGSILRAYDLNIAQVQTLHVAEEARDLTADTIGVNNDGNLDARGRRIVNVGDAVGDYDAINLHMMKTWNTSALNSANAAAASQAAAKTSENNSKTSENNAKTSENNSKTSENNAYQWAQRAEDSPVQGSEFSAYHYSRKSAKSAAAASTSEGNASVSERNAKTSENNAKTSETNAATSAQTAKDEAAKLTNMNGFAAAIDSVSGNNVVMKGDFTSKGTVSANKVVVNGPSALNLKPSDWIDITGNYVTDNNYATNGLRYWLRGNQRADVFAFESVGNHHTLSFHVYQTTGVGAFYEMRHNGYFVGPALSMTGAPGSYESRFAHNIIIQFPNGNGHRYQENGDIVRVGGNNSIFAEWNGVLSGFMNTCVLEVYLGGQEWWQTSRNRGRTDYALGGGHVCTGYTQDSTNNNVIWLDGMFHRAVWCRFAGNRRVIINSA